MFAYLINGIGGFALIAMGSPIVGCFMLVSAGLWLATADMGECEE